ncbi:MAG: hypothetical protein DRI89_09540 [Bacteroidetes bacterium]|nr:MAG: hypothetical protein DRI89_09540 [Bacteroidota bacterium]
MKLDTILLFFRSRNNSEHFIIQFSLKSIAKVNNNLPFSKYIFYLEIFFSIGYGRFGYENVGDCL